MFAAHVVQNKTSLPPSFPAVVNLNVGGQIYTTSLSTLTKYSESMLGAMFSGRFAAQQDLNGNYFIDRDGALFRYVLEFVRNGELQALENQRELHLLLKEAEFYQIPALIETVKQQMKSPAGHKGYTHNETEILTMFGRRQRRGPDFDVASVSGRLHTLIEMFHVTARDDELTCHERTAKLFLGDSGVETDEVLRIAQAHGFRFTAEQHVRLSSSYFGDVHWVLFRP